MEFKEKLINQTSEIAKNKPDFCPFGPKKFFVNFTSTRNCCKLSFYAISRKTNEPNWRKWQKKLVLGIILVYLAQIQATKFVSFFNFFFFFFFFFLKTWLHQSLNIMVTYHRVKYQKKLMIQSWENLETDRRTDRQIDQSDFTGRCPTTWSIQK